MLTDVTAEKQKLKKEINAENMDFDAAYTFLCNKLKEYEKANETDKQIACHEIMFFDYKIQIYRTKLIEMCLQSGYRADAEHVVEVFKERTAQEVKEMFS